MEIELLHQPDSAIAKVTLNSNEEVVAQAGAMIAMSGWMTADTTLRTGSGGGIMGGLKRLVAGESLFLSVFSSTRPQAEIYLAPKMMGDLLVYNLQGQELVVQATSYLASGSGVEINIGFQGLKSLFSGESIFWLRLTGYGPVILNAFGGIYQVPVKQDYIVDTGHIVAFERSLDFNITKAGSSWLGAFLGGEGLVCRFHGTGIVYCQTHNPGAFGFQIGSRLPPR